MGELEAETALVEEAVRRYAAGESVQVLSLYNAKTKLSVRALNRSMQERLNPPAPYKRELRANGEVYRDSDRVIITRNDRDRHCINGDVGILRIRDEGRFEPVYCVELPDGRCPQWIGWAGLGDLALAYALTVHKSQGSQYQTILFPVIERFPGCFIESCSTRPFPEPGNR